MTTAARAGCPLSRKALIEANMRLVINIARSYNSQHVPLEDLIQEGAIGLMHAVQRFDPDKGFRFSTYATHWVRQSIGRSIDNKGRTIRLPAHVSQSLRRVERAKAELTDELHTEPTQEQIAHRLGVSVSRLRSLQQAAQDILSLEAKLGERDSVTLGSLLRDPDSAVAEGRLLEQELSAELMQALRSLSDKERWAVCSKYQLAWEGGEAPSAPVATDRRRQIEAQALKKLRASESIRRLMDYLDA